MYRPVPQMAAIQKLMGALCFSRRAAAGRPSPYADLLAEDLWGNLGVYCCTVLLYCLQCWRTVQSAPHAALQLHRSCSSEAGVLAPSALGVLGQPI